MDNAPVCLNFKYLEKFVILFYFISVMTLLLFLNTWYNLFWISPTFYSDLSGGSRVFFFSPQFIPIFIVRGRGFLSFLPAIYPDLSGGARGSCPHNLSRSNMRYPEFFFLIPLKGLGVLVFSPRNLFQFIWRGQGFFVFPHYLPFCHESLVFVLGSWFFSLVPLLYLNSQIRVFLGSISHNSRLTILLRMDYDQS